MPPLPGLRVVRSRIHGYGVVATRAFAPGEVIAQVDGVVVPCDACENDEYCLYVDGEILYDMVDQTRWINHSCAPNTGVEIERLPNGDVEAYIVSLRAIAAGEELTYDYAFPEELAIPCRCGAATCRGFIVDEDELHLVRARLSAEAAETRTAEQAIPDSVCPGSPGTRCA